MIGQSYYPWASFVLHILLASTVFEQLPFHVAISIHFLQQLSPVVFRKCLSEQFVISCVYHCMGHWELLSDFWQKKKNADCNTRRCSGRNSWWNLWREWFQGDYFWNFLFHRKWVFSAIHMHTIIFHFLFKIISPFLLAYYSLFAL